MAARELRLPGGFTLAFCCSTWVCRSWTGFRLRRTLREEGFHDLVIVAISGYGQEEDRQRSLEAGMNHHVTKPVDLKTIAELIARSS